MSEIVIEEMKDKNYEDNTLVKVLLYYVKNIDDEVLRLHLHHQEYLTLNEYSTDWFKFDGNVYSVTVVHDEKSDLKTIYAYKLEGEESYCLGIIALTCKEDETPDHKYTTKYTIKIEDIDFQ